MMEGVTVHPLKHIVVPKGDIYHALKSTDEGYVGFGEAYFSQIDHGAVPHRALSLTCSRSIIRSVS